MPGAIPRNPQTVAKLAARLPAALAYVYDVNEIRYRGAIRPGEVVANVFDFEDGLRLIVSRERMPDGRVVLHVSASAMRDTPAFRMIAGMVQKRKARTPAEIQEVIAVWAAQVPGRYGDIGGTVVELVGFSDGGIPHFHGADPGGG